MDVSSDSHAESLYPYLSSFSWCAPPRLTRSVRSSWSCGACRVHTVQVSPSWTLLEGSFSIGLDLPPPTCP